jgi:hypothetical protein
MYKFIQYLLFVDFYWSGVALQHRGLAMQTPLRRFLLIEELWKTPQVLNVLLPFLSLDDIGQYKAHLHILSIAQTVLFFLINIVLGIWIYKKAPSNKWGWMLIAFVFGINAVIIFYLNEVLNELSNKKSN